MLAVGLAWQRSLAAQLQDLQQQQQQLQAERLGVQHLLIQAAGVVRQALRHQQQQAQQEQQQQAAEEGEEAAERMSPTESQGQHEGRTSKKRRSL